MITDQPYLYCKTRTTGKTVVFYTAQLTGGTALITANNSAMSYGPNSINPRIYTIELEVAPDTTVSDPNTIDGYFELDSNRNYDPSKFEFIEVKFVESDATGTYRLKGKGTTTQEDADSSDDN